VLFERNFMPTCLHNLENPVELIKGLGMLKIPTPEETRGRVALIVSAEIWINASTTDKREVHAETVGDTTTERESAAVAVGAVSAGSET
jgi:hypothetical protein